VVVNLTFAVYVHCRNADAECSQRRRIPETSRVQHVSSIDGKVNRGGFAEICKRSLLTADINDKRKTVSYYKATATELEIA
jgi:hypothetical protein